MIEHKDGPPCAICGRRRARHGRPDGYPFGHAWQPTCPDDCEERHGEIFNEPAVLFIRKRDGHCVGYRRPVSEACKKCGVRDLELTNGVCDLCARDRAQDCGVEAF